MFLHIGNRVVIEVSDFKDAQRVYCQKRDESGEGASTFPIGRIRIAGKLVATISYNGRAWDKFDKEIV